MLRNVNRSLATLAVVAAALVATPGVAQAQFGGLVNKVKNKVAPQPEKSADAPRFDATTVELTSARLDALVRGLTASVNVLKGTNGNGVQALSARREAVLAEGDALETQHPGQRAQFQNSLNKISDCRTDAFDKFRSAQSGQMQMKMMSDPSFRTKYMASTREMQAAAARGDTAGLRKLQEKLQNSFLPISRADSASVDRQCGKVPAPPAFIARETVLNAERDTLDQKIRDMQEKAGPAGAEASGLTIPQYATAQERIEYFLQRAKNGVAQPGFTAPELSGLRAREAQLRTLMAELNAAKG